MEFPATPAYRAALGDLLALYREGGFSPRPEDIKAWAKAGDLSVEATFAVVARELALDYAMQILSWEFCDWAANKLWSTLCTMRFDDEALEGFVFEEFYNCFDASEMCAEGERDAKALEYVTEYLRDMDVVIRR
ncbi:hypothetical protein [Aurantiacibacter sediminis]|uniref:Colicin D immunity protein domain-containing protein n=1 Tax=Aurantiacibacter sediminis TaxID=2793064 RepID=A0ABS0N4M3_9SPHN|nr:hypothetical protein [Aurantiacibacter sediminis]MBH5322169.1 hypothetical protein [Aurantiacibacter sediminis]